MIIAVEIPDEEIKDAIKEKVVQMLSDENRWGSDRRAFRKEYSEIIKEVIYEPKTKQDIIDKTVKLAAQEIRRKALPKLLGETLEGEE